MITKTLATLLAVCLLAVTAFAQTTIDSVVPVTGTTRSANVGTISIPILVHGTDGQIHQTAPGMPVSASVETLGSQDPGFRTSVDLQSGTLYVASPLKGSAKVTVTVPTTYSTPVVGTVTEFIVNFGDPAPAASLLLVSNTANALPGQQATLSAVIGPGDYPNYYNYVVKCTDLQGNVSSTPVGSSIQPGQAVTVAYLDVGGANALNDELSRTCQLLEDQNGPTLASASGWTNVRNSTQNLSVRVKDSGLVEVFAPIISGKSLRLFVVSGDGFLAEVPVVNPIQNSEDWVMQFDPKSLPPVQAGDYTVAVMESDNYTVPVTFSAPNSLRLPVVAGLQPHSPFSLTSRLLK